MSTVIGRTDDDAVPAPWVTRVVARGLGAADTSNASMARCATPSVNTKDPGTNCFWRRFDAAQPSPAVHNGACRE